MIDTLISFSLGVLVGGVGLTLWACMAINDED